MAVSLPVLGNFYKKPSDIRFVIKERAGKRFLNCRARWSKTGFVPVEAEGSV